MRFARLQAPAFGALQDLDTGEASLGGLVVVEGRNEAGKSTFFELLCVLLYGFYPASREAYPYVPWTGDVAEARGRVRLESGAEFEVHRRLLSTPRGAVLRGDREEELRNRAVPWVEHVPGAVFRQVFALTLGELTALEGQGWATVQDRLLGAMGASDLRSARSVAEELQTEAGALWRPTRRGRQAIRDLRERIRELRLRRHEVLEEDGRIREASKTRTAVAEALDATRRERERARVELERLRTLLPVRRRLLRIAELEERAGPARELTGLPDDVAGRLEQLAGQATAARERIRRLEEDRRAPADALRAFGPDHEEILARRGEVEARLSEWAGAEPLRARRAALLQEIRDRERKLENGVASLLDRDVDESLRGAISGLSLSALHSAVDEVLRAGERLAAAEARPAGPAPSPTGGPGWTRATTGGALILLGLLLLGSGRVSGSATPSVLGGLALGAGLVLATSWHRGRGEARRAHADAERRRAERARGRADLRSAEERLQGLLSPLAPGPGAPPPGPELPLRLERLQEWIREGVDRRLELEEVEARLAGADDGLRELAGLLPAASMPHEPGVLAHLLARALSDAESRRQSARGAGREIARLDRALEEAREEAAAVEAERGTLETHLSRLGGGHLEDNLAEATARIAARARAEQLREELERDHPTLEMLHERIVRGERAGEAWTADPEAEAAIRARVAELDDRVEEQARRIQALDKDLEFLSHRTRLDEIDGEILDLESRVEALVRRRDRLWVLSRVVQEAERAVREEHQPAVLREASSMLAELTGGRYDRIVLTGRDGRDFRIRGPATPESLAVDSPLSTGTREQVYLALRLAILDQLDRSGERLPLFLDEVLVNWDPERRDAGLRLLAERSGDRQCFFFTCHPDLAERLEELGGRRMRLPDPKG